MPANQSLSQKNNQNLASTTHRSTFHIPEKGLLDRSFLVIFNVDLVKGLPFGELPEAAANALTGVERR